MHHLRLAPLTCCLLLTILCGCAGFVQTERKVFHLMTGKSTDRSFAVVPGDASKRENLEFNHHAARTSIYLKDLGYRMIKPGENPDLLIFLDYGLAPLSAQQFRRYLSIAIFDQKLKDEGKIPHQRVNQDRRDLAGVETGAFAEEGFSRLHRQQSKVHLPGEFRRAGIRA